MTSFLLFKERSFRFHVSFVDVLFLCIFLSKFVAGPITSECYQLITSEFFQLNRLILPPAHRFIRNHQLHGFIRAVLPGAPNTPMAQLQPGHFGIQNQRGKAPGIFKVDMRKDVHIYISITNQIPKSSKHGKK